MTRYRDPSDATRSRRDVAFGTRNHPGLSRVRRVAIALAVAVATVFLFRLVTSAQGNQPPTVTAQSPAANASGVATTINVTATFSEPIQPSTLAMELLNAGGGSVASQVSYDQATRTATLVPDDQLASSQTFRVNVRGARDLENNQMADVTWTFTTANPGFQDVVMPQTGLVEPMAIQFASDGRIFVAERSGRIFYYDNLADTTPTLFIDMRTNVHTFWDRGMMGMVLHPAFPATPYVYVLYSFDAVLPTYPPPRWGTAGAVNDGCPDPTGNGCVITGRLSRFNFNNFNPNPGTPLGPQNETVLVTDWWQQFPSHSVGSLAFGADGALYASGGDGASFNYVDYGPPSSPSGTPSSGDPTNEGGALRSQDLRTSGDPVGLDGTIIRIDPDTGAALPDNPLFSNSDANARRIVAYGLRNPFRFTIKPGTNEVWIGDVGWTDWEEIVRIPDPVNQLVANFGWPCYEGNGVQGGYDGANRAICENLYAQSPAVSGLQSPYFTYAHSALVVPGEACPTGSSSISGTAFYPEAGGSYASKYNGALFFADYSRDCIWAMLVGPGGQVDPTNIETIKTNPTGSNREGPVQLVTGPNGDIYYAGFDDGRIHRITYNTGNQAPTADVQANPTSGSSPLTVTFSAAGSSDPEGQSLTYTWDLDGDGAFDDGTGVTRQTTYTSATPLAITVRVRATDPQGLSDVASVVISVNNTPPLPVITMPATDFHWKVGDPIDFQGGATDPEQGALPASSLLWSVIMHHCPSNCHSHNVTDFVGVSSGSFLGPDHEYPSYIELRLTATDSGGLQASTSVNVNPQTVELTFESTPPGLSLAVNAVSSPTPFARTVIAGSTNTISALSPQVSGSFVYQFASWSDGGTQSHNIIAPVNPSTYGAIYNQTPIPPGLVAGYGMNEGSGGLVGDMSGNSLNGTNTGATWTTQGKFGNALVFDGADDMVSVADANALDLTTGMTLEAWVFPTASGGGSWRNVIIKERSGGEVYNLYSNVDTNVAAVYVVRAAQSGTPLDARGTTALPLNTWSHLAVTYDNATVRLFVNGTQVGTRAAAGPLLTSTGMLNLGGNTVWGEFFAGRIDEVRIYNRALSVTEIQSDMNTPVGGSPTDTTPPTVAINQAAGQADPTSGSPINYTVVFSEPVTGFATGDVTLSGTAGATTAVVTGGPTTYTVAVSGMTTSGTVVAAVGAGVAQDAASNANTSSTSTDNTVTFSTSALTVTINQAAGQADPTTGSPINYTVVFSAPVTDFATGDVTLSGTAGATTAVVTGGPTTYTVAVSGMTTSGTVAATLGAGVAHNAGGAGNAASTSTDNTVTFNTSALTVTINQAAGQADPTAGSPINYTVVFSAPVTDFATGDVSLGGTAGATTAVVTGGPTTYNVAVSGMTTTGTVVATVGAEVAHNAGGTGNNASTSTDNTVTYDGTAPTVTINQAVGQGDPTSGSPINFTVVFSESVTGFVTGDVSLSGTAGATTAVVTGGPTTYNVAVSGMTVSGTVVATVGVGVANDAAGNPNGASTSTDNTVTYNVVVPSGLVAAYGFNEASGLTTADASGNNLTGTLTNVTRTTSGKFGSALVFNGVNAWVTVADANPLDLTTGMTLEAWVNPTASGGGSWRNVIIKERPGGEVYNLYSNVDTNVPTVYVANTSGAVLDARGTSAVPLNTWTHLAATYDGTTLQLYVGGTLVGTRAIAGPMVTSTGALRMGGNSIWGEFFQGSVDEIRIYNRALSVTEIQTDMNTPVGGSPPDPPPTVAINQAAGQADPTTGSPINYTVVFSESVTGFATGDVTLSGTAGATTAVVTGGPTTYNVAVSGMTTTGTVVATVGAGVASDGAGNGNVASTSTDNTVTFNTSALTVTINQAAGQADPTAGSPINYTVVFSAPVTDFATGDVSLGGTAGATTAVVTGGPTTYNVAVSGMTTTGTVVATVGAEVAHNAGGTGNNASMSTDNTVTYDGTAPTVTINQAVGQGDPTSGLPINFTVVFSESVTGFATGDVSLSGTAGATTATVTGGPTTYTVAVSGMTVSGTVIATVGAGVALDAAGNGNTASTSTDNTVTYNVPVPITASPASATVVTGTLSSGTAAALVTDDNVYYSVNSTATGTRTAAWYGSFNAVSRSLTSLLLNYKGNNSRNCTQTVAIWNWTTSAWAQLDSRTVGTNEIAISNLTPTGTLANYVGGTGTTGEVRIRVQCQANGGSPFTSNGDLMSIVYNAP